MRNKGIIFFLMIFFLLVLGLVLFFIFKDSPDNSVLEEEPLLCPAVCIEMWEIKEGECFLNECGSGCGSDEVDTFLEKENCLEKLK